MENVFLGREEAALEVRINKVLNAIGDDNQTRVHFESELVTRPTANARLEYCRNFFINLERHREWAHRHLWFVRQ